MPPINIGHDEQLLWQIGGLAPMLAQVRFFAVRASENAPLAVERFTIEYERLIDVIKKRLAVALYRAGDDYLFADIACYPWLVAAGSFDAPALQPVRCRAPDDGRLARTRGYAARAPARGSGAAVLKL